LGLTPWVNVTQGQRSAVPLGTLAKGRHNNQGKGTSTNKGFVLAAQKIVTTLKN